MKRHIVLILTTLSLFVLFSDIAFSAELNTYKDGFINKVHSGYIASAMAYASVFTNYAIDLFWWLVLLDLLYHFIMFFKKGDFELDAFASMIFFRILYAGFFYLILDFGPEIGDFIYRTVVDDFGKTMINAGVGAAGWTTSTSSLSPADFLDIGFSICFAITEKAGFWSKTGLMTNLVAIILIILFMLIIAEIVVAMIEYYLVCSIGYFLLAFGGLSQTRDVVFNYFKTLLAMSFKIMTVYAVTTISFGFIQEVAGTSAQQEAIVADTESLLVLLAGTVLFAILARRVPERIVGIITGAMGGAGGVSAGASGMIRNMLAAGAGATAGAAIATGSAGAAISASAKLAKTQSEASGSASPSSTSTSSAPVSGLTSKAVQTLSNGASFAGSMAKNLSSAAVDTAVSKGLKGESTFANFGGTMANRMDSSRHKTDAKKDISDAGYKPPTMADIKNKVTGKDDS